MQEREIGAVPAAGDPGYGEAVGDDEFAEWVKRSQDDTASVLADWDDSVKFEMEHRRERVVRDDDDDTEPGLPYANITSVIQGLSWYDNFRQAHFTQSAAESFLMAAFTGSMFNPSLLLPAVVDHASIRRNVEAMGLQVVERCGPEIASPYMLHLPPTDGLAEWAHNEFIRPD